MDILKFPVFNYLQHSQVCSGSFHLGLWNNLILSIHQFNSQHTNGGWGSGFIPIAEYGAEFSKGSIKRKPKKAVRLLYSGRNHYDLLVWELVCEGYLDSKNYKEFKVKASTEIWHVSSCCSTRNVRSPLECVLILHFCLREIK